MIDHDIVQQDNGKMKCRKCGHEPYFGDGDPTCTYIQMMNNAPKREIPEEKLKEWREEFESKYGDRNNYRPIAFEAYLAAKTSSYEREQKLVRALRKFECDEVIDSGDCPKCQTLKELGYE